MNDRPTQFDYARPVLRTRRPLEFWLGWVSIGTGVTNALAFVPLVLSLVDEGGQNDIIGTMLARMFVLGSPVGLLSGIWSVCGRNRIRSGWIGVLLNALPAFLIIYGAIVALSQWLAGA